MFQQLFEKLATLKPQPFKVTVLAYDTTLFSGMVTSASSVNEHGPFDILSLHSNFISILKDKLVLRTDKKQVKEFTFTRAILRCFENEVKVYVGI
ncbi:MAG: hypothetical protein ACOX6V_04410 [Patescibacteria group bacterium]|jgi:F0F1-type ATP synthase epsilon subunit